MSWVRVASYSLGFNVPKKQYYLFYTLRGQGSAQQLVLTPPQFSALADLFRHGGVIQYNTVGKYFASELKSI